MKLANNPYDAYQQGKAEAIKIIKRYSKFHIPKAIGDEMIKELKEQTQEVLEEWQTKNSIKK